MRHGAEDDKSVLIDGYKPRDEDGSPTSPNRYRRWTGVGPRAAADVNVLDTKIRNGEFKPSCPPDASRPGLRRRRRRRGGGARRPAIRGRRRGLRRPRTSAIGKFAELITMDEAVDSARASAAAGSSPALAAIQQVIGAAVRSDACAATPASCKRTSMSSGLGGSDAGRPGVRGDPFGGGHDAVTGAPGPGVARTSRTSMGVSHSLHTTTACMSWSQAVWWSTSGVPSGPVSQRSPHAAMAARMG